MNVKFARLIAAFLAWGAVASVHAQSAGDTVVAAGWLHIAPQDSSREVQINALGTATTVPGSSVSVNSADTAGLSATHYFTDHLALQGVFGIPPRFNLDAQGSLAPLGRIASVREWSPTLILQYHFGAPQDRFRPYAGAGVAYVWFNGARLSSAAATGSYLVSPVFGTALTGPTSIAFDNAFAPVLNAGANFKIDAHWSVDLAVSYMMLATKAKLTTQSSVGPVETQTRIRLNPVITYVALGYRF